MIQKPTKQSAAAAANKTVTKPNGARLESHATTNIRTPMFVLAKDLVSKPAPMHWAVRGIVPDNAIIGFVGPPESMKTAVVCDMALAMASDGDWHGLKVNHGPAIILAGEGHAGYSRRLKALEIEHGIRVSDLPIAVSKRGMGLVSPGSGAALAIHRIDKLLRKFHAERPALIVIDTVARNFGAGDENNASDMGAFIENVDYLRRKYRCAVILVHHSGHGNASRARGSSAFKAGIEHEIVFERKEDVVTLKCTKAKDAAKFEPLKFESHVVELPWKDDEGEKATSIVLRRTDVEFRGGNKPEKQIAVLQVLKNLLGKKMHSQSSLARKGIKSEVWRNEVLKQKIVNDVKAFDKLKAKLKDQGKIAIDGMRYVTLTL